MRPDIPLYDAMLCWDRNKGTARIVTHPDERGVGEEYQSSVGACFANWRDMEDRGRLLQFMIDLWHIVAFDNVPPEAAHQAALVVPEYRSTLAYDCLPEDYRPERD